MFFVLLAASFSEVVYGILFRVQQFEHQFLSRYRLKSYRRSQRRYSWNTLVFRAFGCVTDSLWSKELRRGKLESKSMKCYFTGYCLNGNRLWCLEDGQTVFENVLYFYWMVLRTRSMKQQWKERKFFKEQVKEVPLMNVHVEAREKRDN